MRLLAGIALLVATGCSLPVGDGPVGDGEEESFDERASVRASVVIHHTTTAPSRAAASPARVRSHVSARFLRVSGIEGSTAEAVVGLERDVAEAALGCRELEAASPAVPEDASSSIEMLDVGDVSVSSDDLTLPLAARAFPDVGEWVSGVVYTSRDESTPLPAEGSYPRHQAQLHLHHHLTDEWSGDLHAYYYGDAPATGIDAWLRLDLHVGWRPKDDLRLDFTARNLLDDRHPEFPGEFFGATTEVERSVLFTVTHRF